MKRWYFPIAMVILAAFLVLFLFPGNLVDTRRILLGSQFSGMITRAGPYLLLAAGVLLACMLFGRLYCAYLCPAGLLQHLFTHIGRRLGLARLGYRPALPVLSIAIMALVVLYVVLIGCSSFLGPVPGFAILVQPLGETLRHGHVSAMRFLAENPAHTVVVALLFAVFILLPLFKGRVFCNRVCPVGILLGWVNRLPGQRFRILPDKCVSCGQCARVCPMGCADVREKKIDAERCVECWDCANACKFGAIEKGWQRSPERRSFLSNAASAALGGLFVFSHAAVRPGGLIGDAAAGEVPVAPPGSGGNDPHQLRCIACQACVPACPVGIILPHRGRPVLSFRHGYCQYNCAECARSCPAGAISPVTLEEKHRIRLAQVELHTQHCVVKTKGEHCGACAEVCPTHAVSMVEQGGGLPPLPDLDPAYCIGCGGCFHVCPEQSRAFTLNGLRHHEHSEGIRIMESAHTNTENTPPPDPDSLTDFPF